MYENQYSERERERETGEVVKVSLYARGKGRRRCSRQRTQGMKERQLSRSQIGDRSVASSLACRTLQVDEPA